MEQDIGQKMLNNKVISDQIMMNKIELFIQEVNNESIPSIIFEYTAVDNLDFELEDLKEFFFHFGEVLNIVINGKQSAVFFKTFFSANICKVFLENKENYRDNMNINFKVRWFDLNKDGHILPPEIKRLYEQANHKNIMNINKQNMMNNKNLGMNMNLNLPMNNLNLNGNINPLIQNNAQNMLEINPNMQYLQPNNLILPINNFPQQGMMNYNPMNQINNAASPQPPMPIFINQNIQNMNNFGNINNIGTINNINNWNNFQNINNINDINNMMMPKFIQNNSNMNLFNEEKNIGKYTCKYEILIENEP